jgi:hypothetical protein
MNHESHTPDHNIPSNPYYEAESQKPQVPHTQPMIYRKGRDLILCQGYSLQSNVCIKTGHMPQKVLSVTLRNPFKPGSWFGSGQKMMIGLDKKSFESFRLIQTVYTCFLGLGMVVMVVGVISGLTHFLSGLMTVFFGLLIVIAGLVVRSLFPIWSPSAKENSITIRGCGENYLKHFSEAANS